MSMILVCVWPDGLEMTVVQVVMTKQYNTLNCTILFLIYNTDCITCRIMCQL